MEKIQQTPQIHQKRKYRVWCKTCNDFILHSKENEDFLCDVCMTKYTEILIKDIPEDKVDQQRERFITDRKTGLLSKYEKYLSEFLPDADKQKISDVLTKEEDNKEIFESDAGLKAIEEFNREETKKRKIEEQNEKIKFANLGRNDKCLCGSGLKYKRCCWHRIQTY